jgi:hypothetical protein
MREFTKHVILALKEDEWIVKQRGVKHIKSFLVIDTEDMQPVDVPIKFTWFERKVIGYHVRKLHNRMMLAKFIEYRLNPRKEGSYSHENTFLY